MKKLSKYLLISILFFFIISCSKSNEGKKMLKNLEGPEILYKNALNDLNNQKYDLALIKFKEIETVYSLSNEAVQAQIMMAFIEYVKMNYDDAILKFNRIIARYPSHKNIDYAYYMKAMCYFEQIENEELDGNNNIQALQNFNQIINRFPESEYARDSDQKIILVKENIAAKHMNIGLFYLDKKKYLSAMNRFKKIVEFHSTSKFVPEALHRLVEIYYSLGMMDDAEKTASVIAYNYPDSKWYKYSYQLLVPDSKKERKLFLKRLSNLFKKDE